MCFSLRSCQGKHVFVQKQLPEVFLKKGVLKNFAKFTGKHLCQGLFFNKVAGLFYWKALCKYHYLSSFIYFLFIGVESNIQNKKVRTTWKNAVVFPPKHAEKSDETLKSHVSNTAYVLISSLHPPININLSNKLSWQ